MWGGGGPYGGHMSQNLHWNTQFLRFYKNHYIIGLSIANELDHEPLRNFRGETFFPDCGSDLDSDETFQISRNLGLELDEIVCLLDSQPWLRPLPLLLFSYLLTDFYKSILPFEFYSYLTVFFSLHEKRKKKRLQHPKQPDNNLKYCTYRYVCIPVLFAEK